MNRAQEEEPAILPKLLQMGLTGAAGGIITQHMAAPFLEGDIPDASGVDVTNATTNLEGAELISGPADGGAMLDRPAAGYLADHSASQGLDLQYEHESVSQIAADMDKAGTMTVNGETIKVLDYAPGGSFVQAVAGTLSGAEAVNMLGQTMIHSGALSREIERTQGQGTISLDELTPDQTNPSMVTGGAHHYGDGPATNSFENHHSLSMFSEGGDADDEENAKNDIQRTDSPLRQQLEIEHRLALQAALETSDEANISSTVQVGGKSLSIKTHYEARHPDNAVEQKEGEKHLQDVMHRPGNDIQTANEHFRMRSLIESNDAGLELKP